MNQIHYIEGDATQPVKDGVRIIVHSCNDIGLWGKGFVLPLGKRYPATKEAYHEWHRVGYWQEGIPMGRFLDGIAILDIPFRLGEFQLLKIAGDLAVCNLIGQHRTRSRINQTPVDYTAINKALSELPDRAAKVYDTQISYHMPRIGCGLGGGEWCVVENIIEQTLLPHAPVYVYDLPQIRYYEKFSG